jgi:PilZ domain
MGYNSPFLCEVEVSLMAAQGAAPRATLDLKVRVWGMGANNQPFFQSAMAQNVSATGACIYGIEPELKVGDVIGVQYETKKARCKVIWVVDAGALKKTQVGVQLVVDQDCPWVAVLPKDMQLDERTSQRHDNRRKFARHKIGFPLELRDERVNTPLRVNATDISGNGCYVETVMPLPVATALRVDFWIDEEKFSPSAVVRTRDPGVGMGIEFTGLPEEAKNRFQAHLDKIDSGSSLGPKGDK